MDLFTKVTKHAVDNGFVLSSHALKIVPMIRANDGNCPCKKSRGEVPCPCPTHKEEIESNGHCTCNLFLKGK